jgi:hypothetical protein
MGSSRYDDRYNSGTRTGKLIKSMKHGYIASIDAFPAEQHADNAHNRSVGEVAVAAYTNDCHLLWQFLLNVNVIP